MSLKDGCQLFEALAKVDKLVARILKFVFDLLSVYQLLLDRLLIDINLAHDMFCKGRSILC